MITILLKLTVLLIIALIFPACKDNDNTEPDYPIKVSFEECSIPVKKTYTSCKIFLHQ